MLRIRRSRRPLVIAVLVAAFLFWRYVIANPHASPAYLLSLVPIGGARFVPSSFDWRRVRQANPLPAGERLRSPPTEAPRQLPRVQYDFSAAGAGTEEEAKELERRRQVVKDTLLRGWKSYRELAWRADEVGPLTGAARNPFGGWAATLVDSLDTLWIMGLRDEFAAAVRAVGRLDWASTSSRTINVFETTIRHLGGLLSAHELSGEPVLLAKAAELGDMLLAAFDTPNRLPTFWFSPSIALRGLLVAGDADPSAGIGSLFMEFTRLSQLTGDPRWYDAADRVKDFFRQSQNSTNLPGMWPMMMNFRRQKYDSTIFTLGASADSLYEYLPKMYILLGGHDEAYKSMAIHSLETARRHLFFKPMIKKRADDPDRDGPLPDVLFSGKGHGLRRPIVVVPDEAAAAGTPPPPAAAEEWDPQTRISPHGEHLTCFAGGMYMLAGRTFDRPDFVSDGLRLARGCTWAYGASRHGIMPEAVELEPCPRRDVVPDSDGGDRPVVVAAGSGNDLVVKFSDGPDAYRKRLDDPCPWDQSVWDTTGGNIFDYPEGGFRYVSDGRYLLRPEAIESLFYAYRVTGDESYREDAWRMFEAIDSKTRTKLGNAAIKNVNTKEKELELMDGMESFWFAETLKYIYLILSPPDFFSLDDYVFNTEAHPFLRPKPADVAG